MKSLLTAMALMAAVTIYAQPQGGMRGGNMTPEQRAEMMAKRMKTELNLTDEQTEAVKQMHLTSASNQGERPDEETRQKMREQREAELKKILTDEQFTQWQELQKNRNRSGMQARPEGANQSARNRGSADQWIDRMKEDLSLTESQVEQLKGIHNDMSADRKQEMERQSDARKEKTAAYEAELQKVLTPEQYAKWQEMRKENQKKNP